MSYFSFVVCLRFFLSRSTRFLFFSFLQFYFSTLEWKYAIGALFFLSSYFIKKKSTVGWNKMRLESEFSFCYFSIFISPFSSSIRDAKAELYEMNIKHGYCQGNFGYSLSLFPTSTSSAIFASELSSYPPTSFLGVLSRARIIQEYG